MSHGACLPWRTLTLWCRLLVWTYIGRNGSSRRATKIEESHVRIFFIFANFGLANFFARNLANFEVHKRYFGLETLGTSAPTKR